jgi:cytochrome c551
MFKFVYVAFFAIMLVFSVSACGGNDNAGNNDNSSGSVDATAANQIFQKNCASCHGNNLQGNIGPNLQKVGSKMSKSDILNQIKKGGGGMPPNVISGKDADVVATWLASKK